MLLVLDNAEGLLDANLVLSMLGNAPHLKLLITTHEALYVREEWFHPIAGQVSEYIVFGSPAVTG